jgi:hypothetical protein
VQSDPVQGYSVRDPYKLLTSLQSAPLKTCEDLLWHRQVLLKMSIFAWRLLRNRLPIKVNLVARGIINLEAHSCVSGCGIAKSAQHLFISCRFFASPLVRSWIGFLLVDLHTLCHIIFISVHICQVHYELDDLSCSFFGSYAFGLFGTNVITGYSEISLPQLMDKVKFHSYRWLKTTDINLVSNYHSWWTSPFTCLALLIMLKRLFILVNIYLIFTY